MFATTASISAIENRPVSSKFSSVLRMLADRFDAKSAEKTKAERRLMVHRMANSYELTQPNLAAELHFVAWNG